MMWNMYEGGDALKTSKQTSLTPLPFSILHREGNEKAGEGAIDMYIFVGLKVQSTFSIGEGITTTC